MIRTPSPANGDNAIEQAIIHAGANVAPRITPADIQANITGVYYHTAFEGANAGSSPIVVGHELPLSSLTYCTLVLKNGFTVTGESACASPENFNAEIGRKIARENAVAKIWPLMGYELKSKLSGH